MPWRSQQGSATMWLLATWSVLMAFLALALDYGLYYIRQEQLRTAVEAAVVAGAMQGRYKMSVGLTRWRYYHIWEPGECFEFGTPPQRVCSDGRWVPQQQFYDYVTLPSDWEDRVWTPHTWGNKQGRPFRQIAHEIPAFSGHCAAFPVHPPNAAVVCEAVQVVSCAIEDKDGMVAVAGLQAFQANSTRWRGELEIIRRDIPHLDVARRPLQFSVVMDVEARMRTRFLGMFGRMVGQDWSHLPVVVKGVQGSRVSGELIRLSEPPPGCETPVG